MGSLIASHLVAALVNAVVGGALEYMASIDSAASAQSLQLKEGEPAIAESGLAGQPVITQVNTEEAVPPARHPASTLALSSPFPRRGIPADRLQSEHFAAVFRLPEQAGAFVPSVPVTRPLIGSAVHLEMPRLGPNGEYVRPKILIGLASSQLKAWLRSQGVAAEQCMFPMLRARARVNQETRELSAAITMFARCTFY